MSRRGVKEITPQSEIKQAMEELSMQRTRSVQGQSEGETFEPKRIEDVADIVRNYYLPFIIIDADEPHVFQWVGGNIYVDVFKRQEIINQLGFNCEMDEIFIYPEEDETLARDNEGWLSDSGMYSIRPMKNSIVSVGH